MKTLAVMVAKEILLRTPLRGAAFPIYAYNMSPPQLCFLCEQIEQARGIPGAVLEVGCSTGATTVFLARYMEERGLSKEYVCVDTFSGFVSSDIAHEVKNRGKKVEMFTGFRANSERWFRETLHRNGVGWVGAIRADVNDFDFSSIGPIAFCLLDVDLYRPVLNSLEPIYRQLSPGGIVVVDDCDPGESRWDGAGQAFREFTSKHGIEPIVVHEKLGLIVKPANTSAVEPR